MGAVEWLLAPIGQYVKGASTAYVVIFAFGTLIAGSIILNVLSQIVFKNDKEPPLVFHWVPVIGNTISYGVDPYGFFLKCQKKYGDIFTFILLGRKTTVYVGTKGNEFILNAKLADVNAEEIYNPLCGPVFGRDVVYDCPNAKLMEQKKFVKFGLTTEAFREYVPLIAQETQKFVNNSKFFRGDKGLADIPSAMQEMVLFTASRSLQGKEVRDKIDSHIATLFHDLDGGFQPINFMLPWAPLPQNRKRDYAQRHMTEIYLDIIRKRRQAGAERDSEDMIWNLMQCKYRNGQAIPDHEIAHMMIALLMAGQHSSSTTIAFILLRLARNPEIIEELLEEQKKVLGVDLPPLSYEGLSKLTLHSQVIKETLRLHAPIHSIMRKVTAPMHVEGTHYTIPAGHVVLSSPGVTHRSAEFFPEPYVWDPHRWDEGKDVISKIRADDEKTDYGYGLVSKGANSPYLPFGAGRHRCIGEQFAYVQLQTIVAVFAREMILRRTKDQDVDDVPGTDYSSLFSRPLKPNFVQFERRHVAEK